MYKKSNSKGFSLFELLVVIVIISILSGIGFVAYKTTLERTKDTLAKTNYINIDEFIRIELVVINNKMFDDAPNIKVGENNWKNNVHTLNEFLNGIAIFFDIYLDPSNFYNPHQSGNVKRVKQVYSETYQNDVNDPYFKKKGSILLRLHPDYLEHGSKIKGKRFFQLIYFRNDNVIDTQYTKTFVLN
jgi:prepilin-type N-terminal cleavage/methylation domain-containing protein